MPDDHSVDYSHFIINDPLDKSLKNCMNTESYPEDHQKKYDPLEKNKKYQGIFRSNPEDHLRYSKKDDSVNDPLDRSIIEDNGGEISVVVRSPKIKTLHSKLHN